MQRTYRPGIQQYKNLQIKNTSGLLYNRSSEFLVCNKKVSNNQLLLAQAPKDLSKSMYNGYFERDQKHELPQLSNLSISNNQIKTWIEEIQIVPEYKYYLNDPIVKDFHRSSYFAIGPAYDKLRSAAEFMSQDCYSSIFSFLSKRLFHSIIRIPPSALYSDSPYQYNIWPEELLNEEYSLFSSLIPFFSDFFNPAIIDQFIQVLQSPVTKEQTLCINLLKEIYYSHSKYQNQIFNSFISITTAFRDNQSFNSAITPIFQFFFDIFSDFNSNLPLKYFNIYRNLIFPCVKSSFFQLFYKEFISLTQFFASKDSTTAFWSLRYFFHHWPTTNSGKQIVFLAQVQIILFQLPISFFHPIQNALTSILISSILSPNFKVVLASLKFAGREEIIQMMSPEKINTLAKTIQKVEKHWSEDVRNEALKVSIVLKKNYGKFNSSIKCDQENSCKTWMYIVEIAGNKNPSIDIQKTQISLSKYFHNNN